MGLLDFLGLGSGPMSDKSIEKTAKLASNPYAQPDVRREQMDKLLRDGSDAAIRGLLQRFTVSSSQAIADEEEKRYLVDELVKLGDKSVPLLLEYLRREKNLTFAIAALQRILPRERALTEMLTLLETYGPDDYRSDEQKRQILLVLADYDDEQVWPKFVPYVLDHSDEVRGIALERLFNAARAKKIDATLPGLTAALCEVLTSKEASPRIIRQSAEGVVGLEWALPVPEAQLNDMIASEWMVDKKGFLRRRSRA